ncbi:MAG: CRISPR-associated endonuclease Cas3'', partial [Rikenellaceae bacterium]|nr:CRISPR-associated endonuclease Cas3'' [Rikenellaceae bacterium]
MADYRDIWAKSQGPDGRALTLVEHLKQTAFFARRVAVESGLDPDIAYAGALLHDIGKASPLFQKRLRYKGLRVGDDIFRHEIASLFFLSLIPQQWHGFVIEMVAGHHKSVKRDVRSLGLLDLDGDVESFDIHSNGFEVWSRDAVEILREAGLEGIASDASVTLEQARNSYDEAVDYCKRKTGETGWSLWKGVLVAADGMASALAERGLAESIDADRLFRRPDLTYYSSRRSELYPLSLLDAEDGRPHTIVTAPTGAGKTDFLLRRCRGRVFYTLPFQASINAMYDRIRKDLADTDADVRLLHASSALLLEKGKLEERVLQRHVGASVKVMTPHQMAGIAFGVKGYEAMLADLIFIDLFMYEIYTYSDAIQAIVLK